MQNFTHGNITKQLFLFSLPIIAGDILQSLYHVIDAVWVGRLIGHEALAAIAVCSPLLFSLFAVLIGLGIATNILVGQSYGSGNIDYLRKVLTNSFITIMIFCGAIAVIAIIFSSQILSLINTPETIHRDAQTYLVIILGGVIFRAAFSWFSGVLRGLGDSKTPLSLLAISAGINLIVTPLLIVGAGPLPAFGIAGSALASVFAFFVSIFLGYVYFIRKNPLLQIGDWDFTPDGKIIRQLFTVGMPVSGQLVLKALSWMVLMSLVNMFGPSVTAAYGIGMRIDMFAFLPCLSIGIAVSTMVAQNLGAQQSERVPRILQSAVPFSLSFAILFYFLVNTYPYQITSIFTSNAFVLMHASRYLEIVSVGYLAFAFIFALQGVIRGAGDTKYLLLFAFIAIVCVKIPLAYFLVGRTTLRESGIWLAILMGTFAVMLLNCLYYVSGKWRTKVLFDGSQADGMGAASLT
ncbi:MAG: MATE family efflux transporter [Candidatus Omnitrophica bacterium]|nr:MATE family efflux transporter [Candidatus Omnitrophota bacterium]